MEKNLQKKLIKKLVEKYNYRVLMYTEYPHKKLWSKEFKEEDYKVALKELFLQSKNLPLLLYIHIPFCSKQCLYCTCHTMITNDYERIKSYLIFLYKEIDLLCKFFNKNSILPNFQEIHLGGGSPTLLHEKEFDVLIEKLSLVASLKNLSEFSIEIDPRGVDKERLKYYHQKGISRISFGVQDIDFNVQKAINRVQPPELSENLITPDIRGLFKNGINFDIICGLPLQTRMTIKKTFEWIIKMSPDRICFNYLHYVPEHAKHQKVMTDGRNGRPTKLPNFYEKKMLFLESSRVLENNGYIRTGYDHFAKPTDTLTKAMQCKTMGWNALGVTSGRYSNVIGIGLQSYSTIGNYYAQNFYEISNYSKSVENGKFPIYRGCKLSKDDIIRRDVIQSIRNYFYLDYHDIEKKYGINFKEYFRTQVENLDEFVRDGIIKFSDHEIIITDLGQQFTDLVCRHFDAYI